ISASNKPTMTTLKEDLWKTLEDLTHEEFKKFKWLLKDAANDSQAIPAARLENADRQDTVDLMVQRYGCLEALRKSTQLLEKICRNDLAQQMQQFAVDVTLNPNTAHPNLILSEDGKQVHCSDAKQNLPDNPERFSNAVNVLGRQSFSSGRFYYEVQVRGKTAWDLGVVYKSIGRKGSIKTSPDDGHWAICLRGGDTFKAAGLSWSVKTAVNKVGVFVDYEKGLVSFSDVDSAELIHRYRDCSFKEDLHPFFSPGIYHGGLNSTPLVISPLNSAAPPLSAP
ncbi:hypothetical protein GOODEAATRI_031096, partial [Goodea atripinnis]